MTADRDQAALNLAAVAADLAVRIRDENPADVWADIANMDHAHLVALVSVMAGMVPDDRTIGELLAWVGVPATRRSRAKVRAA